MSSSATRKKLKQLHTHNGYLQGLQLISSLLNAYYTNLVLIHLCAILFHPIKRICFSLIKKNTNYERQKKIR